MSLLHEVQETFERAWGVDEGITELLLAMATQLQGRFMTAAGALPPVPIARGLWQGCPNGPRRSMMVMTAVCEYVEACVPGFAVPTPRQGTLSVAEVAAADDVGQMADSEALQQLMLEGFWVGTVVGEIGMGHDEHDASKSAAMTGGFNEGTWLEETLRLFTLPLGAAAADVMMARVRKHYPHLGTELSLADAFDDVHLVRERVVKRIETLLMLLGRLGGLTLEQLRACTLALLRGVLGYYGRATPMGDAACDRLDKAVLALLAAAGHRGAADDVLLVYTECEAGGWGFEPAGAIAGAAYLDECKRILNGPDTDGARLMLTGVLATTAVSLGFEASAACRTPLDWRPVHLLHELDDALLGHAYYLLLLRAGLQGRHSGADCAVGPLAAMHWRVDAERAGVPKLWEELHCTFSARLCALGMVRICDICGGADAASAVPHARFLAWHEVVEIYGDGRMGAYGSTDEREYRRLCAEVQRSEVGRRWRRRQVAEAVLPDAKPSVPVALQRWRALAQQRARPRVHAITYARRGGGAMAVADEEAEEARDGEEREEAARCRWREVIVEEAAWRRCAKGHALEEREVASTAEASKQICCDACGVVLLPTQSRVACVPCDYDVCRMCHASAVHEARTGRAAARASELAWRPREAKAWAEAASEAAVRAKEAEAKARTEAAKSGEGEAVAVGEAEAARKTAEAQAARVRAAAWATAALVERGWLDTTIQPEVSDAVAEAMEVRVRWEDEAVMPDQWLTVAALRTKMRQRVAAAESAERGCRASEREQAEAEKRAAVQAARAAETAVEALRREGRSRLVARSYSEWLHRGGQRARLRQVTRASSDASVCEERIALVRSFRCYADMVAGAEGRHAADNVRTHTRARARPAELGGELTEAVPCSMEGVAIEPVAVPQQVRRVYPEASVQTAYRGSSGKDARTGKRSFGLQRSISDVEACRHSASEAMRTGAAFQILATERSGRLWRARRPGFGDDVHWAGQAALEHTVLRAMVRWAAVEGGDGVWARRETGDARVPRTRVRVVMEKHEYEANDDDETRRFAEMLLCVAEAGRRRAAARTLVRRTVPRCRRSGAVTAWRIRRAACGRACGSAAMGCGMSMQHMGARCRARPRCPMRR